MTMSRLMSKRLRLMTSIMLTVNRKWAATKNMRKTNSTLRAANRTSKKTMTIKIRRLCSKKDNKRNTMMRRRESNPNSLRSRLMSY